MIDAFIDTRPFDAVRVAVDDQGHGNRVVASAANETRVFEGGMMKARVMVRGMVAEVACSGDVIVTVDIEDRLTVTRTGRCLRSLRIAGDLLMVAVGPHLVVDDDLTVVDFASGIVRRLAWPMSKARLISATAYQRRLAAMIETDDGDTKVVIIDTASGNPTASHRLKADDYYYSSKLVACGDRLALVQVVNNDEARRFYAETRGDKKINDCITIFDSNLKPMASTLIPCLDHVIGMKLSADGDLMRWSMVGGLLSEHRFTAKHAKLRAAFLAIDGRFEDADDAGPSRWQQLPATSTCTRSGDQTFVVAGSMIWRLT